MCADIKEEDAKWGVITMCHQETGEKKALVVCQDCIDNSK
jgi:hypothetical protein